MVPALEGSAGTTARAGDFSSGAAAPAGVPSRTAATPRVPEAGRPAPEETERLFAEYARTRSLPLRNQLVERHLGLARRLAGKFAGSAGEAATSREDLIQVACQGLILAVERYDPERGASFTSFAAPTIVGVIKHYLRDHTWGIKTSRSLRELGQKLRKHQDALEQRLGRSPTVSELATAVGVDEERVLLAMEACRHYDILSLDAASTEADRDGGEAAQHGGLDPRLDACERREVLHAVMQHLDERQRAILQARFLEDETQAQVAARLGISQMHVSRLERQALGLLRALLKEHY